MILRNIWKDKKCSKPPIRIYLNGWIMCVWNPHFMRQILSGFWGKKRLIDIRCRYGSISDVSYDVSMFGSFNGPVDVWAQKIWDLWMVDGCFIDQVVASGYKKSSNGESIIRHGYWIANVCLLVDSEKKWSIDLLIDGRYSIVGSFWWTYWCFLVWEPKRVDW